MQYSVLVIFLKALPFSLGSVYLLGVLSFFFVCNIELQGCDGLNLSGQYLVQRLAWSWLLSLHLL